MTSAELLRLLPAVDSLLEHETLGPSLSSHGRDLVVAELRAAVEAIRQAVLTGALTEPAELESRSRSLPSEVAARLAERAAGTLHDVVNATGVILHTNLGRSPLGAAAVARLAEKSGRALDVELDLATGRRGRRAPGCEDLLAELTGAEAACIVNNCAASLLLALNSLSMGRPVVVSRGELVEIGGSFRIPDVCARAGVALHEVGTTNRTRIADYSNAAEAAEGGPGMFLKVHPSNFRVVGFTEETSLAELVELGRSWNVSVVMDQGSGALEDLSPWGIKGEHSIPELVTCGADLVLFSGDKLLGGPQAGCIVGSKEAVSACRKNALYRALRPGRLTLLALEATLWAHRTGQLEDIPVLHQLKLPAEDIQKRADAMAAELGSHAGWTIDVIEGSSKSGGGSSPDSVIPTWLIRVGGEGTRPDRLAERLRQGSPAMLARVSDEALLIDLRTVPAERDGEVQQALALSLAAGS